MDSLSKAGSTVEKGVRSVLSNAYVMTAVKVSLILYAAQIAPRLPSGASALFENTFFKIFAVALIAYFASLDFQLSVILAVVYVLGVNAISSRNLLESFSDSRPGRFEMDLKKITDLLGSPAPINKQSLIEPKANVYPGCTNITAKDLIDLFDGDKMKLQETVAYAMRDLMEKLPEGSDAKENLVKMARVVGTPYNADALTDDSAPLVATMLLNFGYIVSDTCKAPGA